MTCISCGESKHGHERRVAEGVSGSVAPIALSTSRRGLGLVMVRKWLVLVGMRDEREQAGLLRPIAALLLGLIERLIRRLDQIGWGAVPAGDRTGKAQADGGVPTVGVRDAESLNSLSKRFRHLCRSVRPSAGKYDHEFVATIPGDEVSWSIDGS